MSAATAPAPSGSLAVEGGQTCTACKVPDQPDAPITMHRVVLPGHGPQWVCVEPKPCRERAQAQGIYCRVPERRAA